MTAQTEHQSYYVPEQSKLPIVTALGIGLSAYGAASVINAMGSEKSGMPIMLFAGLAIIVVALYVWFRETIRENKANLHSAQMKGSYRLGMKWFIFSEVMFFAAFFGALFYIKYLSVPWLAGEGVGRMNETLLWGSEFSRDWPWTPFWESLKGLFSFNPPDPNVVITPQEAIGGAANQVIANNGAFTSAEHLASPWKLPLLNTALLVSSSFTVHWAHHAVKHDNHSQFKFWMLATMLLGFVFIGVQAFEYYEAYYHLGLTLKSGVYGSTFFMLTGFHGFHVCMGAIILLVQMLRGWSVKFDSQDHFSFEAGSWYWHFVDVVWIFLFFVVYLGWDYYIATALDWFFGLFS